MIYDFKSKPIEGYPNYEISNYGHIRNVKTGKIKIPQMRRDGYKVVLLWKNNKPNCLTIHRLIAIHFLPNSQNYDFIDHIDRKRTNNSLSNLRWCTRTTNNNNMSLRKDNKSGHKYISWVKRDKKWKVKIPTNGKYIHFGHFEELEDAIKKLKEVTSVN